MIGQVQLIAFFKRVNYAIGITYIKTEVIQVALISWIAFGVAMSIFSAAGILMSLVGIFILGMKEKKKLSTIIKSLLNRKMLTGLFIGLMFALTILSANYALEMFEAESNSFVNSAYLIFLTVCIQSVMLLVYAVFALKQNIANIRHHIHMGFVNGFIHALGCIMIGLCLIATTTTNVKVVMQFEVIFSILVSQFIFKEIRTKLETIGMIVVIGGILMCILG